MNEDQNIIAELKDRVYRLETEQLHSKEREAQFGEAFVHLQKDYLKTQQKLDLLESQIRSGGFQPPQ